MSHKLSAAKETERTESSNRHCAGRHSLLGSCLLLGIAPSILQGFEGVLGTDVATFRRLMPHLWLGRSRAAGSVQLHDFLELGTVAWNLFLKAHGGRLHQDVICWLEEEEAVQELFAMEQSSSVFVALLDCFSLCCISCGVIV